MPNIKKQLGNFSNFILQSLFIIFLLKKKSGENKDLNNYLLVKKYNKERCELDFKGFRGGGMKF